MALVDSKTPDRLEIKIDDRIYDVTTFAKKHPGGSIIKYLLSQDATDAFNQFHYRTDVRARKVLAALPSRPYVGTDENNKCFAVRPDRQELLQSFRLLTKDLEQEGFFKPNYFHVGYRVVECVLMFALHFFLLSRGYFFLGTFIGGIAGGRAGWVQHEGGHGSLTTSEPLDKFIQKMGISFGLVTYNKKWNQMHNKHHATPQKEDHDPDIDTLPFVAFSSETLKRGRRRHLASALWLRYQHITFIPLSSCINVFFWHVYLHPREYLFRKFDPWTLFFVALRYTCHFFAASHFYSVPMCFAALGMTLAVSGVYLFTTFSLNHTYMPVAPKDAKHDWIEAQMVYTANINPHPLVNWLMGYLNCQIEHHLFPQMPQFRQPGLSSRIRTWCERNDIPYVTYTFFQALSNVITNLRTVGQEPSLETMLSSPYKGTKTSAPHVGAGDSEDDEDPKRASSKDRHHKEGLVRAVDSETGDQMDSRDSSVSESRCEDVSSGDVVDETTTAESTKIENDGLRHRQSGKDGGDACPEARLGSAVGA